MELKDWIIIGVILAVIALVIYLYFSSLKKDCIKILGEEKFKEVTYLNPQAVLKGEFIDGEFPEEKPRKFSFFKK